MHTPIILPQHSLRRGIHAVQRIYNFFWLEAKQAYQRSDYNLLIGMDIIGLGDFAVTNVAGKTVFTFRIPSVEVIGFLTES